MALCCWRCSKRRPRLANVSLLASLAYEHSYSPQPSSISLLSPPPLSLKASAATTFPEPRFLRTFLNTPRRVPNLSPKHPSPEGREPESADRTATGRSGRAPDAPPCDICCHLELLAVSRGPNRTEPTRTEPNIRPLSAIPPPPPPPPPSRRKSNLLVPPLPFAAAVLLLLSWIQSPSQVAAATFLLCRIPASPATVPPVFPAVPRRMSAPTPSRLNAMARPPRRPSRPRSTRTQQRVPQAAVGPPSPSPPPSGGPPPPPPPQVPPASASMRKT